MLARFLRKAVMVVSVLAPSSVGAQLPQHLLETVGFGDWLTVRSRALALPADSVARRLILGRSLLAADQANDALCQFASVSRVPDLERWLDDAREVFAASPGMPVPLYLLGDAHARLEQWPEATAAFDRALAARSGDPLILSARARSHAAVHDWNSARRDLAVARKARSFPVYAISNEGVLAILKRTDTVPAEADFEAVRALVPDHAIARVDLGVVAVIGADWQAARDHFQAAEHAAPCIPLVGANLLLAKQTETDDSEMSYARYAPGTAILRGVQAASISIPGGHPVHRMSAPCVVDAGDSTGSAAMWSSHNALRKLDNIQIGRRIAARQLEVSRQVLDSMVKVTRNTISAATANAGRVANDAFMRKVSTTLDEQENAVWPRIQRSTAPHATTSPLGGAGCQVCPGGAGGGIRSSSFSAPGGVTTASPGAA